MNPLVEITCGKGRMLVEIEQERAPITAANFLNYVDKGLLNNQAVFRIVTPTNDLPGRPCDVSVVQWGWRPAGARFDAGIGRGWDPLDDPDALPFPPIRLEKTSETGLRHKRGTLSMGRDAKGYSGPHFFFCVQDSPWFDEGGVRQPDGRGFAAFGSIVDGIEVLDQLYGLAESHTWMQTPYPLEQVRRVQTP